LEEIRQWLLIYEQSGTGAQLEHWLKLADRQLIELERQKAALDETITDLRALKADTVASLNKSSSH
jgi:DNA-binding transcriptional MerR regulator